MFDLPVRPGAGRTGPERDVRAPRDERVAAPGIEDYVIATALLAVSAIATYELFDDTGRTVDPRVEQAVPLEADGAA